MQIPTVEIQEWTSDQIYDMAGSLIHDKLRLSIEDFVQGYLDKQFDTCEFMEIVGLLSLLPEDDKYYIGSQRAA